MSDSAIHIDPVSVTLKPGESDDVTITVDESGAEGMVEFPVRAGGGVRTATLTVHTAAAAIFGTPRVKPPSLPVRVEVLSETATAATYRVTATQPNKAKGRALRRLKRDL